MLTLYFDCCLWALAIFGYVQYGSQAAAKHKCSNYQFLPVKGPRNRGPFFIAMRLRRVSRPAPNWRPGAFPYSSSPPGGGSEPEPDGLGWSRCGVRL